MAAPPQPYQGHNNRPWMHHRRAAQTAARGHAANVFAARGEEWLRPPERRIRDTVPFKAHELFQRCSIELLEWIVATPDNPIAWITFLRLFPDAS